MVKSMTAYGRGVAKSPFGRWVVELHSVNRKMLDVHLMMPKEYLNFDLDVRKWIGERVGRGQVTARIAHHLAEGGTPVSAKPLKELKKHWEKVAKELGYDPEEEIGLSFLLERMQMVSFEPSMKEGALRASLQKAIFAALDEMDVMKAREGTHLAQDIRERLTAIEQAIKKVDAEAPKIIENYRKHLMESVRGLFPLTSENEERFYREAAFFAEKCQVTEELTRLASHIGQFRHFLSKKERSIGKTLDFLVQEMHREMNTIASKSIDSGVSQLSIVMRSECEKIREQIQNIE